jgi:hypothetical protein
MEEASMHSQLKKHAREEKFGRGAVTPLCKIRETIRSSVRARSLRAHYE